MDSPAERPDPDARADAAGSEPAWMAGWLFVAGATIGQLSLLLPLAPRTNVGALELNIALTYVGAALIFLLRRRMALWSFHFVMIAGTLLITRGVYYSGHGVSSYGIWYLWVALFSFSYFRRSAAVMHVAFAGVAYAVVLSVRHEPLGQARWLTTIASLLIAGVFIDVLVRRVRSQRQQADGTARNLGVVVDAMNRIFEQRGGGSMRVDLCATAAAVAHAEVAVLWEARGTGDVLTPVAVSGERIVIDELALGAGPTGAARAHATGSSDFSCVSQQLSPELDPASGVQVHCALWQPIMREQTPLAVLSLYWLTPVAVPEESVRKTIALLAGQAAIAIERADLLARLERIAHTDELTGLLNRRAWREELPREMARARREQWPLCVAMLDIDGLKQLNDTRGHHAGDQLLKQNAAAWSSTLRPVDRLARYGGDEFAAILTGCHLEDAQELVDRLLEATPAGHSASVGVVEWDGVQDAHSLMAEADSRLYAAKAGRGKVAIGD